jgi:hypothetical protein
MKTEDLIAALAATSEPVPAKAQARRRILPPLLVGTAIAFVLASLWLGLAPMDVAAIQPGFWLKLGYSAALGGLGLVLAARLARPGARVDLVLTGGAVALVALILMVGAMQLVNLAPQDRMPMMMGASWKLCPWLITAVAAPIYLAMALGLRGLAPTRPALAGLAAGGIGAALYALHCPEYAPAFIAVWYTAGIVVSAVLGAVVGSRLLRW